MRQPLNYHEISQLGKFITKFCEVEVRSRYPFLENAEQRKLINSTRNSILNEMIPSLKENFHIDLRESDSPEVKSTKLGVMDRIANWFMNKYQNGGTLSRFFGLGKNVPFKIVNDPNASPSKHVLMHLFPDLKGSAKLRKVTKNFLTKNIDGTYDVDPYIKEKFGTNSKIYKDLKSLAKNRNALDTDVPSDDRQEKYDIKASMRTLANDIEDDLFIRHRKDIKSDPILAKKFNNLKNPFLNSNEDVWSKYNPQRNAPHSLEMPYIANSPKMEKLLRIMTNQRSSKEDKINALRLLKKDIRRAKTLNDPSKPLAYNLNHTSPSYTMRKLHEKDTD